MIDGLEKIFTSMGKPKQLYSDEESSMRSAKMNGCLNDNEIKSVQTTTHAHTIERFIRTFKNNLYRRLDSLNENTIKRVTHKYKHIKQFNSTEHSIIQTKPNEAGKKEHHLWINWHLQNAAEKNRQHPEIKDGDVVRYELKPSIVTKSREPKWSSTRHRIVAIKGNRYFIPSINKSKMWLGHELMK